MYLRLDGRGAANVSRDGSRHTQALEHTYQMSYRQYVDRRPYLKVGLGFWVQNIILWPLLKSSYLMAAANAADPKRAE